MALDTKLDFCLSIVLAAIIRVLKFLSFIIFLILCGSKVQCASSVEK